MMPLKDDFAEKSSTRCAVAPAYVLTTMGQDDKHELARELGAKQVFLKSETATSQVNDAIRNDLGRA